MTDARTKNNAASKKCYEKTLEQKYADDYEHEMVRQHMITHPDTDSYHWSVVPEQQLYESGYITDFSKHRLERLMRNKEVHEGNRVRDYGLDGLARSRVGSDVVFHGLQAKYYLKRNVCASDIGSFLLKQNALTRKNPLSKGYLYTSSPLQVDVREECADPASNLRHVFHPWKHPDARSAPYIPPAPRECDKPLRADQVDALQQLEDKEGINALHTPCRWGKTMVGGHDMKRANAKLVVAIAPLLVSVENLQDRLACFLPDYTSLLVDSDVGGVTNVEQIEMFLASDGNHVIYSTFLSAVDLLSTLLTDYENAYILVDEIHNANAQLCEFIQRFPRGLVMSATMPEELYGCLDINHTVHVTFAEAICDGIVVDYTLWLPHLTQAADGTTTVDMDIPVEFAAYDSDLTAKAFYLATVMLKTGSRRCIAYLGRQEECDRFMEIVTRVMETYHGLTVWADKIDSTISKGKRKEVLDAFQTGQDDVYHVLTSVRILDEAVDIPRCDSVFITNVGEHSSDIRMMQRSQRSSTKDPKNSSKHNNIILWADGWVKCVGALELLREADPEFHKKVRIADGNYDTSGQKGRMERVEAETREFTTWSAMKAITTRDKQLMIIQQLRQFYETHGEAPKRSGKRPTEKTLTAWIHNRRQDKKNGVLSAEMESNILTLPWWSWDPYIDSYKKTIEDLKIFYHTYKKVPIRGGTHPNENTLAVWIRNRRNEKKNGTLSAKLETDILTLPWWAWDPFIDAHKKTIEELKAFYHTYKKVPIKGGKLSNENILSVWIDNRRRDKKNMTLSAELETAILTLSWWSWDPFTDAHKKMIEDLKVFYHTYKRVPIKGGNLANENTLGAWIGSRRSNKKNGTLSVELETEILTLPWWSWNPRADAHLKTIEDLKVFYKSYDRLPITRGKLPNETQLAFWINNRRAEKNRGTLSDDLKIMIATLPWWSWGNDT
jgi:superfamily II DNA or RNA helicase/sulfur relay (sulfurtransferase) DsrC/TusE family protein